MRARLQPTSVSLRSYGGEELNIVSQVSCCIRCGEQTAESVLQVQKGAPVKLLLGTDLLPQLGFGLVQKKGSHLTDLLESTTEGVRETQDPNNLDEGRGSQQEWEGLKGAEHRPEPDCSHPRRIEPQEKPDEPVATQDTVGYSEIDAGHSTSTQTLKASSSWGRGTEDGHRRGPIRANHSVIEQSETLDD